MLLEKMAEMGGDDRAGVHHGIAQGLRFILEGGIDPHGFQPEGRIPGVNSFQHAIHLPWVDGQLPVRIHLRFTNGDTHEGYAIGAGRKFQVVTYMNCRNEETKFLGKLPSHAPNAVHQLSALLLVQQGNQAVSHLETNGIHLGDFFPAQFRFTAFSGGRRLFLALFLGGH